MKKYISLKTLAAFHQVDEALLQELIEYEIVPLSKRNREWAISLDYLDDFERALRLHRELGVNLQGVDIICRMHNRIKEMQAEIEHLKSLLE